MTMEQKIKMALTYKGISQAKLAEAMETTASNFNQKLKRETPVPSRSLANDSDT